MDRGNRKSRGDRLIRFTEGTLRMLGYLLILLMGILVLDVVWQVLARYLMKSPSSFTDELARFLLIWVGLFGSAYALGKKRHLAIDLFVNRLKGKKRVVAGDVIRLMILLFIVPVLVVGGTRLVWITLTLKQVSASLAIPLGVVYLALPISGLLMVVFVLADWAESRKTG